MEGSWPVSCALLCFSPGFLFSRFDSVWTPRLKYSRKRTTFDSGFRFSILFGHALRPLLMQSETRIEEARFRSETKKNGILTQLEKRLFSPRFFDYWTRQSKKLRFSIQLAINSRIHASELSESPAAYSYEYHTPTQQHDIRDKQPHTTAPATLA